MDSPGAWLIPELSLQSELEMECDRRAAARLSRDQLAGKIDELIQAWYMQHALINRMLGEIRQLEVKLALAGPPVPSKREPEQRHVEMARELLWRFNQH
ncbi:hypothetical protein SLBS1_A32 [Synechococcus phage S-LBS1]|jgi:hypothetical protein|nr:hypothetical protein SLBS1_A32 [Synechococcus phage S-LBS1]